MVSSEAAPFAKTGGLADVLGALPAALQARGEQVAVVIPRFRQVGLTDTQRVYDALPVRVGSDSFSVAFYERVYRGVTYYFADCPPLFDREYLYGTPDGDYRDNALRFAVFCRAALGVAKHLFRPQILHIHDWQAALVAPYVKQSFATDPTVLNLKVLLTIHNLGYQGIFGPQELPYTGLSRDLLTPEGIEFYGDINLLKAGLMYSDAISTVSPTYAREIQTPEHGFGLDGVLRRRSDVLTGILNGVDYADWDPATDRHLAHHYSVDALEAKQLCKQDLLAEFGFTSPDTLDRPLLGIVSRFASQKGFDLIAEAAAELVQEDLQLVVLGNGETRYEEMFRALADRYPERVALRVGYDNPLAHRIEAGSDMFLMPSRYEPCGLNQIYSLRYGTLPVVRATGGLDDTIDEDTGFKFQAYSGRALLQAVREALKAYRDRERWQIMMITAMERDFSWTASAAQYSALYEKLSP